MALVIVSGLPSSGRSTRCQELIADWQARIDAQPGSSSNPSRIVHLTDSTIHLPKTTYASQLREKPARASYLSLVSRSMVKDAIVVADGGAGLNIKGFRYQLWCAAREVGLTCCSVFVNTKPDKCREWNRARREAGEEAYEEETLEEMMKRYEEPNGMTRWDSPLFILNTEVFDGQPQQPTNGKGKEKWEEPPYEQIWEAMVKGKVSKAPSVVVHNRTTSTNYLALLESSTQSLVASILSLSTSLGLPESGGPIHLTPLLPNTSTSLNLTLELPQGKKPPTPAQLQRLRRQFVKIHSSSFATNNVLGKTAKEEGAAAASQFKSKQQQSTASKDGTADSDALLDSLKDGNGETSLEEGIIRRFAVWLQQILQA